MIMLMSRDAAVCLRGSICSISLVCLQPSAELVVLHMDVTFEQVALSPASNSWTIAALHSRVPVSRLTTMNSHVAWQL